jgi:protein-histidine pros-kinase
MRHDSFSHEYGVKQDNKIQESVENFLDFIADAILGVNQRGIIILANLQAEKLFGYTRKELLGNNLEMLVPDRFKAIHASYRYSYFQSPRVREMGQGPELFGKRKDGTEFPLEISLKPFETEEEIIVISTIRDITECKSTEEKRKKAQKRMEMLLNYVPDAIIAVNQEGTIALVNHQTESLFGYTRDELLGNRLEILLPNRFQVVHAQHRSSYYRSPWIREMGKGLELFGKKKDGTEFLVEVSLSPFETEDGTFIISTIRSVDRRYGIQKG